MEQSKFSRLFHLYLEVQTFLGEQNYSDLENIDMFSPTTAII